MAEVKRAKVTKKLQRLLRKEWFKDLRSGKFRQTTGQLCRVGAFCCLGVAVKTYQRVTGEEIPQFSDFGALADNVSGEGFGFVREAFGFQIPCGGIVDYEGPYDLSELNDICKLKFNEIADIVEAQKDKVFND